MNSGLKPLTSDPRDEKFSKITFGAPSLPVFPKTLGRSIGHIKDQAYSLSCTQQTASAAAEYQDGEEFSAAWSWMKYCESVQNSVPDGADPRQAMRIGVKHGFLPQKHAPYSFPQDGAQTIGYWANWPELGALAEPYKKAAYVKVPFVHDHFDSIRAALLRGKDKKQTVMLFTVWRAGYEAAFLPSVQTPILVYHALLCVDFDTIDGEEVLVLKNSYGKNIGNNGVHYMTRDVCNRDFSTWGTGYYVFEDLTPEQIALAKEESVGGRIQRMILQIWDLIMIKFGYARSS